MAEQSISNPAPNPMTAIFIPALWNLTTIQGGTTTSTSAFVGQITMFQGSTLPSSRWAWCDGSLLQKSVYTELFAQIGYTYGGSGDNFALPNCFTKSPYGADNTGILTATYGGSPVASGGNRNLNVGQLVSHNHSVTISPANMIQNAQFNTALRGENYPSNDPSFKNFLNYTTQALTMTAGNAGNSADLLPPFCVVKYIIRVQN
jgi:microcystin-dependent protein